MFDADPQRYRLANARLVLGDRVVEGHLTVAGGVIEAVSEGGGPAGDGSATPVLDLGGDYLTPGVVDLHTDHVEAHVFPRSTVHWDHLGALMAHDAQVVGGGTTTVFDSLSVGASMKRPERREILSPLLDALEAAAEAGMLRAEHFVHLRCEICDPETTALVDANAARPLCRIASVMDHTPGDRQSPDVERWLGRMTLDMQITEEEGRARLAELLDRSARVGAEVRAHVVAACRALDMPLMSHDDRTVEHSEQAAREGVAISEFPTTLAAARRARALGLAIIAGAPNYLRGGSQSGNIAVRDLLAEDLVDILASDYVPRSPIDAAFAIGADPDLPQDLPRAIAMVSEAPARAAGLTDRGRIAPGLRADLVRARPALGRTQVVSVWRAGRRVA